MSQITDVILSNTASDKFYSVNKDGKISVSEFDDEWSTFEMKYLDDFEQKGMRVFDYIPEIDLVFYVLDRDPFGFMWNVGTKEKAGNDSLKGECKLYNQDIIGMKHSVYGQYIFSYLVVIQKAYVRVYLVTYVLESAVMVECKFVEPTNRILPSQVAVTSNSKEMVLAHCPWSNESTQKNIQITTYNHYLNSNKPAFDIEVALGGISYIALNSNGFKMAYADTEGQNIRVYDLKKPMDPPKRFYLGSRPVTMLSMVFDSASKYLACSSNSQTIHVFKLQHDVASSDGIASDGVASDGVASAGVASADVASSAGVASDGVASDGVASADVASADVASADVASSAGVASAGVASDGVASADVASSAGVASDGVASDGVASAGVASDGVASADVASAGVASADVASSAGVASDGIASDGVASDGVASADVASDGIVSSVAGIVSSVLDLGNYVYTVGTTLQTHEVSFAQIHVAIGYADEKLVIREGGKVHGFVKNAAGDLGLAVSFRQIIDIYKIEEKVGKECIRVLEHSVLDSVLVDK